MKIKNLKQKKIKNINKEHFLYQAQVHSHNYKKRVKFKFTPAAIKKESNQEEKTRRVLKHFNIHLKFRTLPLEISSSLLLFFIPFFHPLSSISS